MLIKTPLLHKFNHMHWPLIGTALLLMAYGILLLYGAGGGNWHVYAEGQLLRLCISLFVMFCIALAPSRVVFALTPLVFLLSIAMLILVAFMGSSGGGAQRWISLGGAVLQPSELAKVALVLALARFYHQVSFLATHTLKNLAIPLLIIAIPTVLVLRQPDLGTAMVLLALGMAIMFIAGVSHQLFIAGGVLGVVAAIPAWFFVLHDYQRQRVLTFLNPESDPLGSGYHIIQSKIAIGSAGFWGKGFLQGSQAQLQFLPEKHTDFIFALLAEDFGMAGAILLFMLYAALFWILARIAMRSNHVFGTLITTGAMVVIFLHAAINVGMVMGLLPVVGVPLPFISYGGSSMLMVFIALGFALNTHLNRDAPLPRGRW